MGEMFKRRSIVSRRLGSIAPETLTDHRRSSVRMWMDEGGDERGAREEEQQGEGLAFGPWFRVPLVDFSSGILFCLVLFYFSLSTTRTMGAGEMGEGKCKG